MKLSKQIKIIEGRIDEVRDGLVIATLVDPGGWAYYAEIDIDRFSDVDQPHVQPGTLFTVRDPGPVLKVHHKDCQCKAGECCA